jgi:ribonuclease HI
MQLVKHDRVQLIWMPGHEDIVGDEMTDQLAIMGYELSIIGPKLACGISVVGAKKAVGLGKQKSQKNIGNP